MDIIRENLKFNTANLVNSNVPKTIVLHHAQAKTCTIQDIHQWHLNNGWAGCGYHYFVRKDGSIYKGREDTVIGSHCKGNNTNTLGICFEGDYTKELMPSAQYNSGVKLINYLITRYGKLPIYGHKELFATECPGSKFPLNDFKSLKSTMKEETGYVVTNYLPNGYKGDGSFVGVDVQYVEQYFKDVKIYFKGDNKGVWLETQILPMDKCKELQKTLGTWFYAIR